jgi:hypothetical protein
VFAFTAIVWVASLPLQLPVITFGIVAPIDLGGSWTTDILSGVIAILNVNATEVPVVVLVLPEEVAPSPPTEPAFVPKFDWVVGCEPAKLPEFCCPPPAPRGANVTFGFVPPTMTLMLATGVPPGDVVMALAFMATAAMAAASKFGRGRVGVCDIVVSLGESWV